MTKWDQHLIVIIMLISMSGIFYIKNIATNQGEKYILVEVNGLEYKKITIDNNKELKYLEIDTKYGYNKLEIKNGKVRVIEASCRDKLDVAQGFIENSGQVIVCLPNRMVVEMKSEKATSQKIDAGSY